MFVEGEKTCQDQDVGSREGFGTKSCAFLVEINHYIRICVMKRGIEAQTMGRAVPSPNAPSLRASLFKPLRFSYKTCDRQTGNRS